jgi:palmitoyltransferase ZDHHC3/7/25
MIVIGLTDYVVVRVLHSWYEWSFTGYLLVGLMKVLAGMALASHLRVMLTCPGIRKRGTLTSEEVSKHLDRMSLDLNPIRVCRHCKAYKPNTVHHCRTCNRCVDRMDHHCPWINNCVGQYNHKYFLLFLFYVILGEMYAITLMITRGYVCMKSRDCKDSIEPMDTLFTFIMTIISIFFLIFVCTMGCEQYDAIRDDLSAIDRLQNRYVRVCAYVCCNY